MMTILLRQQCGIIRDDDDHDDNDDKEKIKKEILMTIMMMMIRTMMMMMQPKTKSPTPQIEKYSFEALSLTKSSPEKRDKDATEKWGDEWLS